VADALLRSFRFQVKLLSSPRVELGARSTAVPNASPSGTQLGDGAFQEVSGLDIEMDVQEYQEGGRNEGTIRRIGRAKYQNLVLKRGMFWSAGSGANRELWTWLQDTVRGVGPIRRYDGIVEVMGIADDVVARWVFRRGLPA
jgi:phage tail-like protein